VRLRHRLLAVIVLVSTGCRREAARPARDPTLAELPVETRVVVSVDLARIRRAPLWTRLAALAEEDPADRARIETMTVRTGLGTPLDPLRQVGRILAAFPDSARTGGQFALVIDGQAFDEKRLVAYAREEAAARGVRIDASQRAGRRMWVGNGPERTGGFFVGTSRFVLGGGGWAELMAGLSAGSPRQPSAADNEELARLCARIDRARGVWFAAIIPLDVRRMLLDDPHHDSAASVTRLAAAIDLEPGLKVDIVADLSNAADARVLARRIQDSAREAKRNAQVLMLGLAPYLDALSARADGPSLRVELSLTAPQVRDLLDRLVGLVRMARGR
jgi:hypothetical protein